MLGAMLEALERGFEKFRIDFSPIGVLSADVWMAGIKNINPRRTTSDIEAASDLSGISAGRLVKEGVDR